MLDTARQILISELVIAEDASEEAIVETISGCFEQ